MKTIKYISIAATLLLTVLSCSEDKYGEKSDVNYPIPVIKTVTDNPMVGTKIVITGDNFIAPNIVSVNGISMKIVSQDENIIEAILPRVFETAPIIVRSAYGRYSENKTEMKPKYPAETDITVTSWPVEITRGRPFVIMGTNVDLVKQVVIGQTTINIDGLMEQPGRIVVDVPTSVSESSSKIVLKTVIGSVIESAVIPVIDYDPSSWIAIDPVVLIDFEDGLTRFSKGDFPDNQYTAQINRSGIIAPQGSKFFSLYVPNVSSPYSKWTYMGSIKMQFEYPVKLSVFHDPYISFLWNSDDDIGSFQLAMKQGSKTGGATFSPGKTEGPNAKYDLYTLRPTNGNWQWVTARLKDLVIENWGGGFSGLDLSGKIDHIELIFKQINGANWKGTYGTVDPNDIYNWSADVHTSFKGNIDQIMITDGPKY